MNLFLFIFKYPWFGTIFGFYEALSGCGPASGWAAYFVLLDFCILAHVGWQRPFTTKPHTLQNSDITCRGAPPCAPKMGRHGGLPLLVGRHLIVSV
jgi:hypothetical protein